MAFSMQWPLTFGVCCTIDSELQRFPNSRGDLWECLKNDHLHWSGRPPQIPEDHHLWLNQLLSRLCHACRQCKHRHWWVFMECLRWLLYSSLWNKESAKPHNVHVWYSAVVQLGPEMVLKESTGLRNLRHVSLVQNVHYSSAHSLLIGQSTLML